MFWSSSRKLRQANQMPFTIKSAFTNYKCKIINLKMYGKVVFIYIYSMFSFKFIICFRVMLSNQYTTKFYFENHKRKSFSFLPACPVSSAALSQTR